MADSVEFTTAELVAAQLQLNAADALCTRVAAAVNDLLAVRDDLVEAGQPIPSAQLGATMLAARLHRRRNSPGGIESFVADGAVYVSRQDPDVAVLLRMDYPGVG